MQIEKENENIYEWYTLIGDGIMIDVLDHFKEHGVAGPVASFIDIEEGGVASLVITTGSKGTRYMAIA